MISQMPKVWENISYESVGVDDVTKTKQSKAKQNHVHASLDELGVL